MWEEQGSHLELGRGEVARKWLAWFSLSDLALATLGKEKGNPESSLNSLWGTGLTGLMLALGSVLQTFFPYREIFYPRRPAFSLTSKIAGDLSLKEASPTHYNWDYTIQKGKVNEELLEVRISLCLRGKIGCSHV